MRLIQASHNPLVLDILRAYRRHREGKHYAIKLAGLEKVEDNTPRGMDSCDPEPRAVL